MILFFMIGITLERTEFDITDLMTKHTFWYQILSVISVKIFPRF